ncbi:hypothetical protein F383_31057 [Gossypium arboreum]|uniref:Uncharacterized protein n=1 Tax=Gossypium arboreum TaxID=29729 RepID=A0A0B0MTS2_GOSAR|nr:hypothetical protein F383_31057 [Gossypium arboreum]
MKSAICCPIKNRSKIQDICEKYGRLFQHFHRTEGSLCY